MMSRRYVFLLPVMITALQGCGSGNSEEIASLQKQVAVLTRRAEETRKQVDTLQEANRKFRKSLDDLESEVDHLKVREVPPPPPAAKPSGGKSTPAASTHQKSVAKVSCAQVWKLLGQGRSEAAVAQALGTTVEAVRSCEQEVGRGGTRR
ncbi:MAG: hypothetical protein HYZ72_14870, partial [Deltaproteobacteria bacterium]|nr:hypothetical protein [Deltaproteobacteria bacterium]